MRFNTAKALSFSFLAFYCLSIAACGSDKAPKTKSSANTEEDASDEEDEAEAKPTKTAKKTEAKPELNISKDSCPTGVSPCPAVATLPATATATGTGTITPGSTVSTATGTGTTASTPWVPTTDKPKSDKSHQGQLAGLCWIPILPDFIKQNICTSNK